MMHTELYRVFRSVLLIQFETFGFNYPTYTSFKSQLKSRGKEGKDCIYFTQQNKDPLSAAVPQQSLAIIIHILLEPVS